MSSIHHTVFIHHQQGALHLRVSFALSQPWTVLFGPSGGGKSSILRAIAGLLHPHEARITRGEHSYLTNTRANLSLPPHRRSIGYAPQRASLFPHLTVQQNVAYGQGDPAAISELMSLFQLQPLAGRLPAKLSGGERQRVNLARAFAASNSRLLLLDEPFNGLDLALRDELLPRISSWLTTRSLPVLSVTHDVIEALQLNAEVITLEEGKTTAQGPAAQILATQRTQLLQHLS